MSITLILGFLFGVVFLFLLLAIAFYVIVTQKPVPPAAMFILRTILALAGAGAAGLLAGFLDVKINIPAIYLQAGGGLAVFVVIFRVNPPALIQEQVIKPNKPRKIKRPIENARK